MKRSSFAYTTRGLTFIDVLVGTALLLVVFMGFVGVFRASVELSSATKARAGATALAAEHMEFIRALSYADTGTQGGIPAGVVPQTKIITLNNIKYTIHTFIQYIDDEADGVGAQDENGINTDYKKVRVVTSYAAGNQTNEVSLISTIAPRGIESVEGGGTLKIQVADADGDPVPSALVHIYNSSITPEVNVTSFTNPEGILFLPGAKARAGYEVAVSKTGFSQTQTYEQNEGNINPSPRHLTVQEGATTQQTFYIDALSELAIFTAEPIRTDTFLDTFLDGAGVSETMNISIGGGELSLSQDGNGYLSNGSARSVVISPQHLSSWDEFTATTNMPAGTSLIYRVLYNNGGSAVQIPDNELPGNSAGFTDVPIDLSMLSVDAYDKLYVEVSLQSSTSIVTPSIQEWSLSYAAGPIPLPNTEVSFVGNKTIGEDAGGTVLPKTSFDIVTDTQGRYTNSTLEWDVYSFATPGYSVAEACPEIPLLVQPNTSIDVQLILEEYTADSLRVIVTDANENFLEDVEMELSRGAYAETGVSSACGQAFFGGLSPASNYTLTIYRQGEIVIEDIVVDGASVFNVALE